MTAYNREHFIEGAIASVFESTYTNFELIVVDDGSKDRTVNIIKDLAAKEDRIKLHVNEKNLGDYPNRNMAASYANGEFIMYVDSDDLLYPATIKNYIDFLIKYPYLNFAIYNIYGGADVESQLIKSKVAIEEHYFKKSHLLSGPGGIFIRTSFFKSLGYFPVKYGPANDSYFNVKAASKTDVLSFSFVPLYYRRHDSQESNNEFSYIYNNYQFNKDLINIEEMPLMAEEKKKILQKNNRRFIVNVFKYFKTTRNFKKTFELLKRTGFTFRDAVEGVFH